MSGFTEENMRTRLKKLNNSTQSIQTLSLWLIHHQKKHAQPILKTWLKEVNGQTNSDKLLSLVYLANDVIQNCRKKHPEFMRKFLDVLEPAFSHISTVANENCKNACRRILKVWEERLIYKKVELDALGLCLNHAPSSPTSAPSPAIESPTVASFSPLSSAAQPPKPIDDNEKIRAEFEEFSKVSSNLTDVLRSLDDPPSADAETRQKIATYPEDLANPACLDKLKSVEDAQRLLAQINDAMPLVEVYCQRLKKEMADRRALQKYITKYEAALGTAAMRNQAMRRAVNEKIEHIGKEREMMLKHIESLPSFDDVPQNALTLPSITDLFK
ncbi:RNA polymerase II-binding domain containing protein [Aphelenchoides avenae]|nr:RNA polymerase II-binding domain containing protein [Aphelenchus avenae]